MRSLRNRQESWLVRWSPVIVLILGLFGAILTGYLTATHYLGGGAALCNAQGEGCDLVLSSEYAQIFGIPLPIFGMAGYLTLAGLAIAPKFTEAGRQQDQLRQTTSFLQFIVATTTFVFSGYLMYLLAFVLKTPCLYCITSATTMTLIWLVTLLGNRWQDVGQLAFTGFAVTAVTITGSLVLYGIQSQAAVVNQSFAGRLANHLQQINAKMYGAYTCPFCRKQKELFGQAADRVPYIECAPNFPNAQPELCRQKNIEGYPTWEIKGSMYSGLRSLNELADLSGYQGSRE